MVLQRFIDNKHTDGKKMGRHLPTGSGPYTQAIATCTRKEFTRATSVNLKHFHVQKCDLELLNVS